MKRSSLTTRTIAGVAVGAAAAVSVVALGAAPAYAVTTPSPWAPGGVDTDGYAVGGLVFYDASGNVITSGSTNSAPIAAYVVGTGAPRTSDTKATMFVYVPQKGLTPDNWHVNDQVSTSTTYPVAAGAGVPASISSITSLPVVTGKVHDTSFSTVDNGDGFPPPSNPADTGYYNTYEVRVYTSGTGGAGLAYDYADVQVDFTANTWSVVWTPQPASAPATAPTGTIGDGVVHLAWSAPSNTGNTPLIGYNVQYSSDGGTTWHDGPSSTKTSTATSADVTGLTDGVSYVFRVAAVNKVGDNGAGFVGTSTGAYSAASTALTPAGAPAAPAAPTGTTGNALVHLSWVAPTGNGSPITGYQVRYSSNGGTTWTDGPTSATTSTATSVDVTGLTNGTTYVFDVAAINAVGTSAFSGVSAALTPGSPDAPTAPTGTVGDGVVHLSWAAPADNGSAITGYHVQYSNTGGTTWTDGPASAMSSTATGVDVTGLTDGTGYVFRVAAINGVGASAYSPASATLVPVGLPGAPTNVHGTAGNASVTLSWTAPSSNGGSAITGYEVDESTDGTTYTPAIANTVSTATSATVSGLTNGTTYTFEVRAINTAGTGNASTPSASVTPPGATAPAAPTAGTPTATPSSATVKWTAGSDGGSAITAYTVQYKVHSSATWVTASSAVSPTATSYVVTGLKPGVAYDVRVAATNAVGTGPFSAVNTVLTPADSTVLSISRSTAVAYGKTLTVSGTLTDNTANKPLVNVLVSLYAKPSGKSSYVKVKSVLTSSTGVVAASGIRPTISTVYQWRYAGDASHRAVSSAPSTVIVRRTATIRATPTVIRKGRTARVYGVVAPVAGGTATLQRKSGTRWINIGSVTIRRQKLPNNFTASGFVYTYHGTAKGRFTLRVVISGVSGYGAGVSTSTVTVSVV